MSNAKKNVSVYFTDNEGKSYFLLQILNFGKEKDELKFIFNDPESNTSTIYMETKGAIDNSALIRPRPEVTYHNDGSLLHKLVGYKQDPRTIYRNPHGTGERRTPINRIAFWDPVVRMKIVDYRLCRKDNASNYVFMPESPSLFDGKPLECRIYLGDKLNQTPIDSEMAVALRLSDIALSVDVLVVVFRSDYNGERIQIGESDTFVWSTNTVIEVIERVN